MDERNKWAFWGLVTAGLAIVAVPSSVLLDALRRYESFLEGFEPGTVRPSRMRSLPHRGGRDLPADRPKLEFVDFKLRAPKARKVCLVGDFNHWTPETLPLARVDGRWELTLPLPPGRYLYRFIVDGREQADPDAARAPDAGGKPASIKDVP